MILIIKGRLTGANEYINAERRNRYMAAKIKKDETEKVAWECRLQKLKAYTPTEIIFTWYEKDHRRDKDNIAFAKKFILDGLVTAKVLAGDGWKGYGDFSDRFEIDRKNPRVEVELL